MIVQCPSFGQVASTMQTALSVLQWPGMVGQLASLWHSAAVVLHVPSRGQSVSRKQADATREHVPATVGHCALPGMVQTALLTLHVPVAGQSAAIEHAAPLVLLLLHVPGGQVVSSVQVPHSSVQRLQPGGFQSVVQVAGRGGVHTGVPGPPGPALFYPVP